MANRGGDSIIPPLFLCPAEVIGGGIKRAGLLVCKSFLLSLHLHLRLHYVRRMFVASLSEITSGLVGGNQSNGFVVYSFLVCLETFPLIHHWIYIFFYRYIVSHYKHSQKEYMKKRLLWLPLTIVYYCPALEIDQRSLYRS